MPQKPTAASQEVHNTAADTTNPNMLPEPRARVEAHITNIKVEPVGRRGRGVAASHSEAAGDKDDKERRAPERVAE